MNNLYLIVACYRSQYGTILYTTRVKDIDAAATIDLQNVYLNTHYFKGSNPPSVGDVVKLEIINAQDGKSYVFMI